jgi:O-antigen/teichoic acid export membrane protein
MEYTTLVLAALGLFGILIHNLVKLNELNRKNEGELNFSNYLKLERFSIAISICVVIIALIVKTEIKQLEMAGQWLGLSFVAIGYMAQSIVVAIMGRAQNFIDKTKE